MECGLTSESPLGAPAILFSPDSIGLSEATVGASSSYSPPLGIVYGAFFFWYFGVLVFLAVVKETLCRLEVGACWEALVDLGIN